MSTALIKRILMALALLAAQPAWAAAPTCKGNSKNDPDCGGNVEAPVEAAIVDSVTVDWFNQALVVRGSGFAESTEFLLGSSATPLATANLSPTQVDLPFNSTMATEVGSAGNYNLAVDGVVALSVYIEAPILDPSASLCPCTADWEAELGILWDDRQTECFGVLGPGSNDAADISGTVLSAPGDATVYPQFPIGASFYPGQPNDSYCALVRVNANATVTELVNSPVNELQQENCADVLEANVCLSVTTLP